MSVPSSWSSPLALVACLLAACATDPNEGLVGSWRSAPEDLQPSGWYEIRLSFSNFGAFEQEARNYGIYQGQQPDQLSAYNRLTGRYRVDGAGLTFHANREAFWDPTFYGPEEQEIEQNMTLYDEGRFVLDGDHLVIHFTSYPADAPVPAVAKFTRER